MDATVERRQLEMRQLRRMERRNAHRDRVRTLACPSCKAGSGHPCRSPQGELRVHNHRERQELALAQGVVQKGKRP